MKKSTKIIVAFICILVSICFYANDSFAADKKEDTIKKQYEEYVNKIMIPKYGEVKNINKLNNGSGDWQEQKGVITTYTTDMNHDGKKECIVFYIDDVISDDQTEEGEEDTCLRMAILSKQKEKVIESDNIVLISPFNHKLYFNYQFYIKTYKNQKYIILQEFCSIEGIGGANFYILSVKKDNTLSLEKGIFDPGYTSGLALYRLNKTAHNLDTCDDYYDTGTKLYESDNYTNAVESKKYKQKLKDELKEYGLEIKTDIVYPNVEKDLKIKQYMLKEDSTLKLINIILSV